MSPARRWLPALLPLAAGAAAIGFSWERWINPFLDSGREMVVPARIAAGERLYRDVSYHYGPAGPWLNALVIEAFGSRWTPLVLVGLILSAIALVALYRLTRTAGSPLSALVAVTLAAAICLGAPNGGAFLFPYSFGALFALAGALGALARSAVPSERRIDPLASAALLLALTAKPETGLAAAALILLAGICSERRRPEARRAFALVLPALAAAALLYAAAFVGLSWELASPEGPLALLAPPAEWRNVYRLVAGLADPAGSLASLATALFLDVVILGGAAAVAAASARSRRPVPLVEGIWIGVVAAATAVFVSPAGAQVDDRLPGLLAPAPLAAAAAAAALLRRRLGEVGRARFLLFGFAAVTGARVLLAMSYAAFTTPYSILAFPALAAACAVLTLDVLALRLPRPDSFRRAVAAVLLALALLGALRLRRFFPPQRAVRVVTPSGSLRLPPNRAVAVAGTLEFLARRARPGDGIAGFPEGGFFNFVTAQPNPLRQDAVYPGHLDEAAAARLIQRIAARGPRFVLLINQVPPGFGPRGFGVDYATTLWEAIEGRYEPMATFGDANPDARPGDEPFFIRVYERRP